MTDSARVLFAAAVLSLSAFAAFGWRVSRADPTQPERLIGELRLAQWAAVLLSATGAASMGFAAAQATIPLGTIDVTIAILYVLLAGFVLLREPRAGLLVAALGFLAHALIDLAHRPGWLSPELVPRWYVAGSSIWDLAMSSVCLWARRR